MKDEKLGRLGFSDTPPVITNRNLKDLPPPPVVSSPQDSRSFEHQVNCLAWYWTTTSEPEKFASFEKRQGKELIEKLKPAMAMCKAWVWLLTLNRQQIQYGLGKLPIQEREQMREYLNSHRGLSNDKRA